MAFRNNYEVLKESSSGFGLSDPTDLIVFSKIA